MGKSHFHRRRLWIGLALALLGVAAVATALVGLAGSGGKGAVVATKGAPSAAIGQAAIVPLTTTTTPTVDVPAVSATVPPSPATTAPATTRPPAAAAAATIPTVRPHADPATSIPETTVSTTIPPTTVPGTTSTTAPPTTAKVSIINRYTGAVQVTVDGHSYTVASQAAVGPVTVTPAASGNDIISVTSVADPTCGVGDAMKYFYAGSSYELQIAAGGGRCTTSNGGITGPSFNVAPTLDLTG